MTRSRCLCRRARALLGLGLAGLLLLLAGCQTASSAPPGGPGEQALVQAEQMPRSLWAGAVERATASVQELREQTKAEMERGVSDARFARGDRARRQIALTFDDGPHPGMTEPLLKILADEHVKATFFVVGMMAEKAPHLVEAELAAGHAVGNHTYHHVNLTKIPAQHVEKEIRACDAVLKKISGRSAHLFRPPGGQYNVDVAELARRIGYTTILWTDDPGDYASPGTEIILKRTIHEVSNGGVILLHDGIQQTLDLLPDLIHYLKAKGYELVLVDEMLTHLRGAAAPPAK